MNASASGHEELLSRALDLAEQGRFAASPNPMVGAVLTQDGEIIGEGYHARCGEPHAEINALEGLGSAARDATLYVTLEPCAHQGRTPPCTQSIIEAGIKRVVIATLDPNPRVSGRGVAQLKAAGIETQILPTGTPIAARATRLNEKFNHWVTTGRPWITLKLATSLDGRIATATGASQWITGEEARTQGHFLRATHDCVAVGSGTALTDDPSLTVRHLSPPPPFEQPARLLLDSTLQVPVESRFFSPDARRIVATAINDDDEQSTAIVNQGAEVWRLPGPEGRVDLSQLMVRLGSDEKGPVSSVLVEGGGTLAAALIQAGLVQRLHIFMAPSLMGGDALAAIGSLGISEPSEAPSLMVEGIRPLGGDLEIIATFDDTREL